MKLREVTLDFKQQSRNGICITLDLLENIVINVQNLVKVRQQRLALEDKGVGIDAHIVLFVLIVLVVDFTYNLLQNILQRHNTAGAAKLIDDNGNMHLVLLELAQQVVNLLRLRNEIRRTDERLPAETAAFRQVGQQILDIQDATNVVAIVLIDGNA